MTLDFFNTPCKEAVRTDVSFGICDNQDGSKAYTETKNKNEWIASVINKNSKEISFTPIDNCIKIYKPDTNDQESTCDGMLTFTDSLFLVELKKQMTGGWLPDAIGQLKNTIRLLIENHESIDFKFKKAFACNRKHPNFKTIDNELSKRFFKETNGFRFDANSDINIK
jgi:hypothetical protein